MVYKQPQDSFELFLQKSFFDTGLFMLKIEKGHSRSWSQHRSIVNLSPPQGIKQHL